MTTALKKFGAADEFTKMEEVDEAVPGLPSFWVVAGVATLAALFCRETRLFSGSVHADVEPFFRPQFLLCVARWPLANQPGLC